MASQDRDRTGHRVTLSPAGLTIVVEPDETVVDGLRRLGYRTRYKCRRGGCGVCRATLVEGVVSYPAGVCTRVLAGDGEDGEGGTASAQPCLPCRAVPETDVHLRLGPSDRIIHVLGTVSPDAASGN